MGKAEEYRSNAAECRALANHAVDQYVRESLLQVAVAWDQLAISQEQLEKHRKNGQSG